MSYHTNGMISEELFPLHTPFLKQFYKQRTGVTGYMEEPCATADVPLYTRRICTPIGQLNFNNNMYNLDEVPVVKIVMKEQKETYNGIVTRNFARNQAADLCARMIDFVESLGQSLSAADKREFREVILSTLDNL